MVDNMVKKEIGKVVDNDVHVAEKIDSHLSFVLTNILPTSEMKCLSDNLRNEMK